MNGLKNNQSVSRFADQLIRYYKIPFRSSKKDALNAVFKQIERSETITKKQKKSTRLIYTGVSVAAVVTIAILFWFLAPVQVSPENGEILTCRLPDHSRVVLQEESTLSYNRFYWNRKVHLKGEAYFEVKKGDGFCVKTQAGQVDVLGTRFLVSNLANELSVKCFEGKVKTTYDKKSWILEPGEGFEGTKSEIQLRTFEKAEQFPGFAKFNRNFLNENLADVAGEIERFFNVNVEIREGREKKFSGVIHSGSLESTLQILCESLQLNYRFIENNKIEIFK